jgi:hypothetical protein
VTDWIVIGLLVLIILIEIEAGCRERELLKQILEATRERAASHPFVEYAPSRDSRQ